MHLVALKRIRLGELGDNTQGKGHECLTHGLKAIGAPARICNMVASIYAHSTGAYGDVRFPLRRGIKEGCPLSPALFVLVYEAVHQTLSREFPQSTIPAYVDDIAINSPDKTKCREHWTCERAIGHAGTKNEFSKNTSIPMGPTRTPLRASTAGSTAQGRNSMVWHTASATGPHIPLPWSPAGSPGLGTKGT